MNNFNSLEVVNRVTETKLQVAENKSAKHDYARHQIKNDQPGSHDFRRFLSHF